MAKRIGKGGALADLAGRAAQGTYDATATVGRITSWMGLILGSVFGLLLIGLGIFVLLQKQEPPKEKENDKDAPPPPPTWLFGISMLGLGIIIMALAVIGWYVAQKSKVYAAATGFGNILNVAT